MNTPRRAALRGATAAAHQALDAAAARFELTEPRSYGEFLAAIARALLPLECFLARSGVERLFADWDVRRRSEALHADLGDLGVDARFSAWARPLAGAAELYGMVYVLEGSRLGGRRLLSRLTGTDDSRVHNATRYLRANDVTFWRSFLQQLEAAPQASDMDSVITGAHSAFALYQQAFRV